MHYPYFLHELSEKLKTKYGIAIMDGKEVEVGNYMAEPPGIKIY